ncbi:hypothetical protein BJX62DRAFT_210422 [Aspergillus germanicus]
MRCLSLTAGGWVDGWCGICLSTPKFLAWLGRVVFVIGLAVYLCKVQCWMID